jgi:hypothetical protein
MGMNGINFEYTNEYGFHADLIYKWFFCQAYVPPSLSLRNICSRLSWYHMTYRYNFYPMTTQLPG